MIASHELVLRAISVQQIAVVERLRDPSAIARGALRVLILALLFLCYSVPTGVAPYLPVFPVLSIFIASADYEFVIEDFYFG